MMIQAFIEPDLLLAHIRISNRFNPFTAIIHPTYILKSEKSVEESDILKLIPGCTKSEESSYGMLRDYTEE